MADFRTVQTRMWREDGWFLDLSIDARYFWMYLFTNPSASICGMYRLPLRTIVNETGIPEKRVKELFALFAKAGKAHYENDIIWVVRMRENQLGDRISENQMKGIEKDLAKIPASALKTRYLKHYGYPIDTLSDGADTLSIGVRNDTVTDTLHNGTLPIADEPPAELAPPRAKPATPPDPTTERQKAIMVAYRAAVGYKLTTEPQENKAAKDLARLDYTPEQVTACYQSLKAEDFWSGKHLSLVSVAKQIGAFIANGQQRTNGTHGQNGSGPRLNPALEAARQIIEENAHAGR